MASKCHLDLKTTRKTCTRLWGQTTWNPDASKRWVVAGLGVFTASRTAFRASTWQVGVLMSLSRSARGSLNRHVRAVWNLYGVPDPATCVKILGMPSSSLHMETATGQPQHLRQWGPGKGQLGWDRADPARPLPFACASKMIPKSSLFSFKKKQ